MLQASVYPNRISVTNHSSSGNVHSRWADALVKKYNRSLESNSLELSNSEQNLSISKSNWKMSYQSKKKFLDSCHFLFACSKPRTVKVGKKFIYNFQASFITLTLPVAQFTSDLSIKQALNHFFVQLRRVYSLKNYVWKAELQKNGSIHFHILIDIPIPHQAVRYYWNQAIEVLGYVSRYSQSFRNISLKDYAIVRNQSVELSYNAYIKGKESNWSSPPTEQVRMVRNIQQLGAYLAKYITKPLKEQEENATEEEIDRIISFGRFWGRSQSLSKIIYSSYYDWNSLKEYLSAELATMRKITYDWCTNYYLNRKSSYRIRKWFTLKMQELGYTFRYPFPVEIKFAFGSN